jgi:hypothetical protein
MQKDDEAQREHWVSREERTSETYLFVETFQTFRMPDRGKRKISIHLHC